MFLVCVKSLCFYVRYKGVRRFIRSVAFKGNTRGVKAYIAKVCDAMNTMHPGYKWKALDLDPDTLGGNYRPPMV